MLKKEGVATAAVVPTVEELYPLFDTGKKPTGPHFHKLIDFAAQTGSGGIIGADGKSAYEIAVENGFVGNEAAWLESLKGKDGTGGGSSEWDDLKNVPEKVKNIDQELNTITTQLADKAQKEDTIKTFAKNRPTGVFGRRGIKPTILMIDDDMRSEAYQTFKDYVDVPDGIPYTFAAIATRIRNNDPQTVTRAQFDEIKNHPLVEILNHTETHIKLGEAGSLEEVEREIANCEAFLLSEGIYTRALVPPWGSMSAGAYKIAKKYVDTIFVTRLATLDQGLNCVDGELLNTEPVARIDFSNPIEKIKECILWASQHNALLVISTHSAYPRDEVANPTQNFIPAKMVELIAYAKSLNVEFANYTTAYDRFKNVIEHRDESGKLLMGIGASGKQVGLSAGGVGGGDFITVKPGDPHFSPLSTDAPSTFPKHAVIKNYYTTAEATASGMPSAGTLLTYTTQNDAYAFQEFYKYQSHIKLHRYWDNVAKAWTDWQNATGIQVKNISLAVGSIPANATKDIELASAVAFTVGDGVIATPITLPPDIIIGACWVSAAGKATLRLYNTSAEAVDCGTIDWRFKSVSNKVL